jgi:hypothetical protein
LFGGGGFLYFKFVYLPKGPTEAVNTFIQGVQLNDAAAVQGVLSKNSLWVLKYAPQYLDIFRARQEGFMLEKQYKLVFKSAEGNNGIVNVAPGSEPINSFTEETLPSTLKDGYPFFTVREGDKWKVDLSRTIEKLYGPAGEQLVHRYSGK